MALQSPGIQVTVVNESFYLPAAPGTTPLIVIATGQNKTNAAATSTAAGTLKSNAGKVYKIASQRELIDFYGVPYFQKNGASPVHGGERNEYGLQAAYSILEVTNAAFVIRADIDLDQLEGDSVMPGSSPVDGAWWVNTASSIWGINEWNGNPLSTREGQTFTTKTPIVLTDVNAKQIDQGTGAPLVGSTGDYAIVFRTVTGSGEFTPEAEQVGLWYKSAGNGVVGENGFPGGGTPVSAGEWVVVGSKKWAASHPTIVGNKVARITVATGGKTFVINGTTVTVPASGTPIASLVTAINGLNILGVSARLINSVVYLYTDGANDSVAGDSTKSNAIQVTAGTASAENLNTDFGIDITTKTVFYGPALQQTPHTIVPEWKLTDVVSVSDYPTGSRPSGSIWIKTTTPNLGARVRANRWSSASLSWKPVEVPMYESLDASNYYLDRSGGGAAIPVNSLFIQANSDETSGWDSTPATAKFRIWTRAALGATTITSPAIAEDAFNGTVTFKISETVKGELRSNLDKTITFTPVGTIEDVITLVGKINDAGFVNIAASYTDTYQLQISHKLGGNFRITDTSGHLSTIFPVYDLNSLTGTANLYTAPVGSTSDMVASNWKPFAATRFVADATSPMGLPEDGQLWYDTAINNNVDIMVHNGKTWVGYRHTTAPYYDAARTTIGPIVSASNPYSEGVTQQGDIWISTSDMENFPRIYRYDSNLGGSAASEKWALVDNTDQQTEAGILFADARYGASGQLGDTPATIAELLTNNFLDPDAPDPALYPKGMLLWNLRRSGGNVKKYSKAHFNVTSDNPRFDPTNSPLGRTYVAGDSMVTYNLNRWVTVSMNNEDGSGSFGRHAQRSVVVAALKSIVQTSLELKDEERRNFNLLACPGYPELMSDLVGLNIERGLTAFVVGDTPLRLSPATSALLDWGTNANMAFDNGDTGMVTYDDLLAVFYPNGYTTDMNGSNIVVPSSHMMLKTIALSDNVSYPWFAPAGTRRGAITNATSVGYIDASTGEFNLVALNEGQRDTLYEAKINPITFFSGVGHVNFGQKTRSSGSSAMDRINVARLTVYLRIQLNRLARPFIFEPNDRITRDEIKQACDSLMMELVGLRAIADFAVVCDESNNSAARVDRNELYVDIAIVPVKAVEFIYIPLRVKNTGAI